VTAASFSDLRTVKMDEKAKEEEGRNKECGKAAPCNQAQ
jgi:hypothetical protein